MIMTKITIIIIIMIVTTVADGKREARYSAWLVPSGPLLIVDLDDDHYHDDEEEEDDYDQ